MWWSPTAAAQDEFVPLSAPEADASSFLRSNWNRFTENYHPNYILDGDPATAWVEGVDGPGVGEWVGWRTSVVDGVHRVKLRVRNGYQKSSQLLAANAAPAAVTLSLRRNGRVVHEQRLTLERRLGWQEVVVDPPGDVGLDEVRLTVVEATPGSVYADLCLSDVELWVDAETAWSAPFERSKQLALQAWIADRKAAAAFFASQPESWPFAASHFASTSLPEDDALPELRTIVDEARAVVKSPPAALRRVDGTPPRLPDGVTVAEDVHRWLAADLSLFEATDPWRYRREQPDSGLALDALGNARVAYDAQGRPTVAVFPHEREWMGRSDDRTTEDVVVWFDGEGRPRRLVMVERATRAMECTGLHEAAEVTDLERDARGRVRAVTRRHWSWCEHPWVVDGCAGSLPPAELARQCPSAASAHGSRAEARP